MTRVLIAEGEPLIAAFIERGLRANGYATRVTHDALEAADLAATGDFEVAILDERIVRGKGTASPLGTAGEISGPTLLLLVSGGHAAAASAATELFVRETLTKPFKFGDLLVRVRSLLRAEGIPEPSLLRAGGATLDLETRHLTVRDETFQLSANELAIAEVLFRQAGQDLGASDLLGHARQVAGLSNLSPEPDLRSLREKLGSELVTTVGLVGYRLRGITDD